MSRLTLLEPPYAGRAGALLARMMPGDVPPIGLFRMFARNLPMADAMHGWGRYELGRQLTLTMREREIVIDRTCVLCGCEYEWGVHMMMFAERVGLTREPAASLVHGGAADECWTAERERLLILAVDALHERSDIDDALWTQLVSVFDELQLLDLLLLCGWYHAVSFAARARRASLRRLLTHHDRDQPMSTAREHSEARLLSPSLMFIALVVVAVAGLGTPLHPLHRMHEIFLTGGSR